MNLYVNESNNESLIHLLKKFRLKILLPMLLSRIIIRLQSILITEKHVFSQEFIFLLTIMIYNRFGEKEKALKLSKKYLNHRSSWRIEKKYKELNDGSYSNLASN